MTSSSKMEVVAQALQLLSGINIDNGLLMDVEWKDEPGIKYVDVTGRMLGIAEPITKVCGEAILEGVEIEAIQVIKGLKPHYHNRSDSVVYCAHDGDYDMFDAYFEFDGKVLWLPIVKHQLIQIPRGVPHGFRVRPGEEVFNPLTIVAATFPPIAEGDTIYL